MGGGPFPSTNLGLSAQVYAIKTLRAFDIAPYTGLRYPFYEGLLRSPKWTSKFVFPYIGKTQFLKYLGRYCYKWEEARTPAYTCGYLRIYLLRQTEGTFDVVPSHLPRWAFEEDMSKLDLKIECNVIWEKPGFKPFGPYCNL